MGNCRVHRVTAVCIHVIPILFFTKCKQALKRAETLAGIGETVMSFDRCVVGVRSWNIKLLVGVTVIEI